MRWMESFNPYYDNYRINFNPIYASPTAALDKNVGLGAPHGASRLVIIFPIQTEQARLIIYLLYGFEETCENSSQMQTFLFIRDSGPDMAKYRPCVSQSEFGKLTSHIILILIKLKKKIQDRFFVC